MTFAEKKIIEKSSKIFFSGTVLSRFTGLVRDILTAYAFGSSASVAALMVAFRFSSLLRRLFGEGALHAAFVPAYEKIRGHSEKKATEFFLQLSMILILFLIVLIGLVELGLGSLSLIKSWSPSSLQILHLTMILLPTLFFICSSAFFSSLLQCHNLFFLPSASPAIFNLFWILGAFLLQNISANKAVYQLAIWILVGVVVQWMVLLPCVFANVKDVFSFDLFKNFSKLKKSLKVVVGPLGLGIVGVATTQINSALDSLFARYVSLEGPAYLWYAIRVQQVPLALFGIAMAGAVLPSLARAYNRCEEEFTQIFNYSLSRAIGLLAPCFFALILMGPACINLVYGRGHFNAAAAHQTTYCLWAYSLGLLPQGLILIIAPTFYVRNDYFRTTRASIIALLLNVFLNAFFAFILKIPAWGVAMATAISSWFHIFYLGYYLLKGYSFKKLKNFFQITAKVLFTTIFSTLCAYFFTVKLNRWLPERTLFYFPRNFHMQIGIFLLQTLTYLVFLFGTAFALNLEEILALLEHIPFVKRRR